MSDICTDAHTYVIPSVCALRSQPLEHVDTLGHETALRTQHLGSYLRNEILICNLIL